MYRSLDSSYENDVKLAKKTKIREIRMFRDFSNFGLANLGPYFQTFLTIVFPQLEIFCADKINCLKYIEKFADPDWK